MKAFGGTSAFFIALDAKIREETILFLKKICEERILLLKKIREETILLNKNPWKIFIYWI